MFEWYDLRMIDLYPQEKGGTTGPTPLSGVIGEPLAEIAEGHAGLCPEEIRAALSGSGEQPAD